MSGRIPWPVSARRLHRRTLYVGGARYDDGSLFPLFDTAGRVRHIMIVVPQPAGIYLLPWRPNLLRVPLVGPVRVLTAEALMPLAGTRSVDAVRQLWHYDPWWVLDDDAFTSRRMVDILKRTNSAHHWRHDVKAVYFSRDLSRLTWIMKANGMMVRIHTHGSQPLPTRCPEPETATGRRHACWVLDPVWHHWTTSRTPRPGRQPDHDGVYQYTFDAWNRLVKIEKARPPTITK
jgi:hypothetical protein